MFFCTTGHCRTSDRRAKVKESNVCTVRINVPVIGRGHFATRLRPDNSVLGNFSTTFTAKSYVFRNRRLNNQPRLIISYCPTSSHLIGFDCHIYSITAHKPINLIQKDYQFRLIEKIQAIKSIHYIYASVAQAHCGWRVNSKI